MDEILGEKQLEAVTGGGAEPPTLPPCKFRCVKCGFEFMMDGAIIETSLRCPKQFCDGTVIRVRDA